jgi:hypothetical protein
MDKVIIVEAVMEDVIQRFADEYGTEVLALDWGILDNIVEEIRAKNDSPEK